MPFVLTSSPAVFLAVVNDILGDMFNKYFSHSQKYHIQTVLQSLLEKSFFVNPENWEFHSISEPFLSYSTSSARFLLSQLGLS